MNFFVTLLMPIMGVLTHEIRQGSRVIAGEDANYKEYPFYGLVVYKSQVNSSSLSEYCGSSLISDYFFLTAAHCMVEYETPDDYVILMGVYNRCRVRGYKTVLDVDSIFLPPGFNFSKPAITDIALMKTKNQVVGYDKILLPTNRISPGRVGMLIGFGSTVPALPGQERLSCKLKQTPQKIMPKSKCFLESDKAFCAMGTESKDSSGCIGDSGGPWMTKKVNRKSITYEITGVASATAPKCLASTFPNVLTDVFRHLEWINGIIA